jgi:hypothetical protein
MPQLDSPVRTTCRDLPERRLCEAVEGVEFWVALRDGGRLRCVIIGAALHRHYGAHEEAQQSWLEAFDRHRDDIEARALQASGRRDDVHVVILNDGAGVLRAVANRMRT